jgi:hypothetical protein
LHTFLRGFVSVRPEGIAMHTTTPITVTAAAYSTCAGAVQDFESLWSAREGGGFHHTSIAVLVRKDDGNLGVERYDSTAKHLTWGGALLGGPLLVVAPAPGVEMLTRMGTSGAGAFVNHVRENVAPRDIVKTARALEDCGAGLVVVMVNRRHDAIAPLLQRADRISSMEMPWGDLEEELCADFMRPMSAPVLVPM